MHNQSSPSLPTSFLVTSLCPPLMGESLANNIEKVYTHFLNSTIGNETVEAKRHGNSY